MLGALTYISTHDAEGKRVSESVQDGKGTIIKHTVYGYDRREHRTAEVSAWADGTFENASFYDYDEQGHRIRGLHFNAPNLINRNSFQYDAEGRVIREVYGRNYTYKSDTASAWFCFGNSMTGMKSPFDMTGEDSFPKNSSVI